jgi:hypothetical protein
MSQTRDEEELHAMLANHHAHHINRLNCMQFKTTNAPLHRILPHNPL